MSGFTKYLSRMAVAYGVLLISVLLSLIAFFYVRAGAEVENEIRFNEATDATREAIGSVTSSYVDAMLGARGLFDASDSVTSEEWRGFVESLQPDEQYPGLQALGYVEYVRSEELKGFLERESLTLRPDLEPSGERAVYYPVTYVEPQSSANKELLGRDLHTSTVHRATMNRARDSGEAQATSVVYVLGEAPKDSVADLSLRRGFAVYLPVYSDGKPTDTVEGRRKALEGFVVGTFRMDQLLNGVFEGVYDPKVDFEVYDGGGFLGDQLLYDDDGVLRAGNEEPDQTLTRESNIEVAGREWSLYFTALPEFERGSFDRLSVLVLLSGLAVSLLLFGVSRMLVRSRLSAEQSALDLEVANRDLGAANRELEAFSHSVSHDLRAPLRSIDGFSRIVIEDYSDKLDDEGRSYLNRVRAASQRMGLLIDDLLNLSRVTRSSMRRETVDLSVLVDEVVRVLKESEPGRSVEAIVQPGLEASADPRLLRVALENLLGNAWKFTSANDASLIEFGVERDLASQENQTVYFVRDNGAGFDMAYADKLFGAFQRLHSPEEFEGTGVGLATVKRVMRRHGGDVWATSSVGEGATFFFTLDGGPRLKPETAQREVEIA